MNMDERLTEEQVKGIKKELRGYTSESLPCYLFKELLAERARFDAVTKVPTRKKRPRKARARVPTTGGGRRSDTSSEEALRAKFDAVKHLIE